MFTRRISASRRAFVTVSNAIPSALPVFVNFSRDALSAPTVNCSKVCVCAVNASFAVLHAASAASYCA